MTSVERAASMTSSLMVLRHDPFDLGEESVDEAEVASGDAGDGGDGLGIGEVFGVQGLAEPFPAPIEDEQELVATNRHSAM